MTINLYKWNEIPKQIIFDGNLSRSALRSDAALVVFNWFRPGTPRAEPHSHPFDQLVMVVEGRMKLEVAGEVVLMSPGSAVRVPSGKPHTAWPIGRKPVLNVDVFGTVRKDYLFLTAHQHERFADRRSGRRAAGGGRSQGVSPRKA